MSTRIEPQARSASQLGHAFRTTTRHRIARGSRFDSRLWRIVCPRVRPRYMYAASPQTAMNRIFKIYSINRFVWNSRSYMHLGCHKTVHMRLRFLGVRTAPEFETRDRINRMKNRRVPPCTTDKERLPRALAMFRIVPKFETHARQRLTFPFPFVHH